MEALLQRQNHIFYTAMQVFWCLKFRNMTKLGEGQFALASPTLSFGGQPTPFARDLRPIMPGCQIVESALKVKVPNRFT